MVLLVCAGLLGKSLYRLLQVDLGLRPDHLVTMQIAAPALDYGKDEQADRPGAGGRAPGPGLARRPVRRHRRQRPSRGRQRQHHLVPGAGPALARRAQRVSRARRQPRLLHDPGRDAAARALLHRGRRPRRSRGSRSSTEAMARQYFPDEDPLGKQLSYLSDPPVPMEIVGIVEDIREGPARRADPAGPLPPLQPEPGQLSRRGGPDVAGEASLLPALSDARAPDRPRASS